MRWGIGILLVALWAVTSADTAESYGDPFSDPFVATVIGTPTEFRADLPKRIPIRRRAIKVLEDHDIPDVFWYNEQLRYSFALQRRSKPAPLIFIIAGTGGSHSGKSNLILSRAFFQAGFHVISMSSPTFENFIVSSSRSGVPGHATRDAEDLYRAMERVWADNRGRAKVTDFYVTGYSLGAFNAAYLSLLDEQQKGFNFKKVLLINPPVRLYSSISLLDRMLENIPGGVDNFERFLQTLFFRFSQVYKFKNDIEFGQDFLYEAQKALNFKDEELAALIGVAFRIASANMSFTSDVMTDFGYIKPKNQFLTKNTALTEFRRIAVRVGFTDFFHEFFYPFYKAQNPSITRESLIEEMSLESIEDYLRSSDKIEVMHNEDDIILEAGEIDFFRRVFGERAKIFPIGGHFGNMAYRDNVAHMLNVFKE